MLDRLRNFPEKIDRSSNDAGTFDDVVAWLYKINHIGFKEWCQMQVKHKDDARKNISKVF